jgi:hypothetical protein
LLVNSVLCVYGYLKWKDKQECLSYRFQILICAAVIILLCGQSLLAQDTDWRTDYEKSGYTASPRYEPMMKYLRRLEQASPWIKLTSFGTTPQGRDLPLVILSKLGTFTPAKAHRAGLPVILVQSGIHSGEIDGKDASLMLLREIAVTKSLSKLADHALLLFMPVFNADGHERQSRYNRINQDGPLEMGWRVTANNLNLNRDFLKADTPEMRAWLETFNEWLPDFVIDIHVTDGIDFQYNLTYGIEMQGNAPSGIVQWQKDLERNFIKGMEAAGDPVCPYVWPREDSDLSKGLLAGAAPPRFSTGYVAIRNRAALLIETHMLKPYKARVTSTYRLLTEVLAFVNGNPNALRNAVTAADRETVEMFRPKKDSVRYALSYRATEKFSTIDFLGYESEMKKSPISGGEYQVWKHDKPKRVSIPLYNVTEPVKVITAPAFYLIPQEWSKQIEVLRLHGVKLQRLAKEQSIPVRTTVFSKPKWREAPYEGRHTVEFKSSTKDEVISYPAGTYVVRLDQPSAKAALHLLEPDGPDSFVSWGFFDSIFEQKEYFEDYMMEPVATELLKNNPSLKKEFEDKLARDTTFSKNPQARLNFFYERSPYADAKMNVYPVGKCMTPVAIDAEDEVKH